MATQKITDYERKRLENIRRNEELMASLKLQSMATQLSASTKRPRIEPKSYKVNSEKKPKTQDPTVIRRSLRSRGLPPDAKGLGAIDSMLKTTLESMDRKCDLRKLGPISRRDVYSGVSDRELIETILGVENKPQLGSEVKSEFGDCKEEEEKSCVAFTLVGGIGCGLVKKEEDGGESDVKVEELSLKEENVARVVPGNVMNVRFFPSCSLRMVVVGNKVGNVGFWNMDSKEGEENGIYMYRPHSGPISGISIHQDSMSKIFSSCYDGFIRSMDAEKEVFDLVYASDETVYALAQQSNNAKCLYFAEGRGGISMWDERTGNISAQWSPHDDRINSIDFNSLNSNIITTSSTDGTACIWDLRSNDADKFKSLKTIGHKRAVHSAYFSPSGRSLVTTSLDDTVGISSGVNFEDISMIHHNNNTSRWIPKFKAIWGWDDAHVFVGNKNRGVDVISPFQRTKIFTLNSPYVSAIPCRFAAHPYNVGMLAGATGGGQVYVWTLG
ncbi:PREDICTED: WD repeat-containing protein 76 [Fragaria vesca subsp. vesca]|uniref:WD repeat-containing protein 76 n=1 Tax=Fragaria vesca subsp. vesca TaxID=101020 RepID=UPI0002C2F1CB|nr:PREDICTED: WD repeat-containing protein 76 [Fragaria vesca subsp. vesca]